MNYFTTSPTSPWGLSLKMHTDFQNPPLTIEQVSLNRWRVIWPTPLSRAQKLWLAQAAYPGWRASALYAGFNATGWLEEETVMEELNAIGSLIHCPENSHGVEVYYAPDSYRTGAYCSLLSLCLIGVIAPLLWRRRPRPGKHAPIAAA